VSGAFWNKILLVDLSTGHITVEAPGEHVYHDFLGGTGLAARFIYENQTAGADPLGEANILALVPGLLCGSGIPMSSRCSLAVKSPITTTWGDSNVGGYLGAAIKKAGYDGVFIKGIAPRPVYLLATSEKVELRPAENLWGKLTSQTQQAIKEELGDNAIAVAAIGPAGEKRCLASCIIHDQGRAAARSGLGVVMGAKNLKAVAFQGNRPPPLTHPDQLQDLCSQLNHSLSPHSTRLLGGVAPKMWSHLGRLLGTRFFKWQAGPFMVDLFHRYGTTMWLSLFTELGDTPVKNWSGTARDFPLEQSSRISDRQVVRYLVADYGCADCPVRCGGLVKPEWSPRPQRRPEYEVLAAFGPLLLNDELDTIFRAYDLCNGYGLDAIEVGSAIALLIEAFEEGRLTLADTDGLHLRWGDAAAIIRLVEMTCRCQGLGQVLANGVAQAAKQLGLEDLAMQVHGQALGMHHPLYSPSLAISYLADPTPGRPGSGNATFAEVMNRRLPLEGIELPQVSRFDYQGKGEVQAAWSHYVQVLNCLGVCQFSLSLGGLPLIQLLNAATGWDYTVEELLYAGERVQNLRHLFNLREGHRPEHFKLPARLVHQLDPAVDVDRLLADYFKVMDWDPVTGQPSPDKMAELGLSRLPSSPSL